MTSKKKHHESNDEVAALLLVLKEEDRWGVAHKEAAQKLGQLGNPDAIAALIALARNKTAWHRAVLAAIKALGKLGASAATDTLMAHLNHEDYAIQCAAAKALGEIGAETSLSALVALLNQPDKWGTRRYTAASALSQLNLPDAIPPMLQVLKATETSPALRDHLLKSVNSMGIETLPQLVSAMIDLDQETRKAVAETLNRRESSAWLPVLPDAINGDIFPLETIEAAAIQGDIRPLSILVQAATKFDPPTTVRSSEIFDRFVTTIKTINQFVNEFHASWYCKQDYTRFKSVRQGRITSTSCRTCKSTLYAARVQSIVATLDEQMGPLSSVEGHQLKINWLKLNRLFDFDEVDIITASDQDIMRFCMLVGNDSDAYRIPKYARVKCTIHNADQLNTQTRTVIKRCFPMVDLGRGID